MNNLEELKKRLLTKKSIQPTNPAPPVLVPTPNVQIQEEVKK
jgi:hypothetical protein